jgi:hypothetical protein
MIGKMNLIPAERRDQGLATCFGTFYPEAHRLREIQEDIRNPLWLGLRPQSFIPWAAGVFQGAVMKTYCTPLGREALVHYHGTDSPAPLPLIIPVQRNTDIGEQLNFNVQLDEATILLS